ncbi:Protein GrpE [Arthrobacter saudimassiliensis]|uniref:Protein GrpE n=1 Tax=Arthrobacter saudimassiliensis TaxID=1461584 RepID=A0A078MSA1_9MICC|nr:Protein GrpE [Arthrobacter saudimassiliensis]
MAQDNGANPDPGSDEPRGTPDDAASQPAGAGSSSASGQAAEGDALSQAEQILNSAEVPDAPQAAGSPEAEELRGDLLRLQAEYVNYRRRVERDRDVAREMAVIGVINALLPTLDDIEAARQHGDLAEGPFAAIAKKLESALGTFGLTRIDETGVDFDPNIHEALMQQQSADVQSDTVTQILRIGYKAGDRVLRAAQVVVSVPEQ